MLDNFQTSPVTIKNNVGGIRKLKPGLRYEFDEFVF